MLNLEEYLGLAERSIRRFAAGESRVSMLGSDEAIGFVAHGLMRGGDAKHVVHMFLSRREKRSFSRLSDAMIDEKAREPIDLLIQMEESLV